MTRHLDALACILIGSVGAPNQLPKRIRLLRPFSPALDITPITMLQKSAASVVVAVSKVDAKHLAGISRQFSEADANVLRWSARQILSWDSSYDDVDVRHIHGDRDHVFPISCVDPDEVVFGGGHVISMTHGDQVNDSCGNISLKSPPTNLALAKGSFTHGRCFDSLWQGTSWLASGFRPWGVRPTPNPSGIGHLRSFSDRQRWQLDARLDIRHQREDQDRTVRQGSQRRSH